MSWNGPGFEDEDFQRLSNMAEGLSGVGNSFHKRAQKRVLIGLGVAAGILVSAVAAVLVLVKVLFFM